MSSIYTTTLRRIVQRSAAGGRISAAAPQTQRGMLPVLTQQHAWMGTGGLKNKGSRKKTIAGNRGSRGHGWYVKYRSGRGGRHLQGEYHDRTQRHGDMNVWNQAVFSLGSQYVYLDVAVEPPQVEDEDGAAAAVAAAAAAAEEGEQEIDVSKEAGGEEESEEAVEADADVEVDADADTEPSSPADTEEEEEEEAPIKIERLVIQVASTVMPETCINFIGLCQEESYKDSILYRIEKGVGICGGDVLTNSGSTGQCWQSMPPFGNKPPRPRPSPMRHDLPEAQDEPLALWHTAGIVTMLCAKVNEIDSRFLLCSEDALHLDGIHRAFGKLEPESLEVVREWHSSVITANGKPRSAVLRIVDCGVLEGYEGAAPEESSTTGVEAKAEA